MQRHLVELATSYSSISLDPFSIRHVFTKLYVAIFTEVNCEIAYHTVNNTVNFLHKFILRLNGEIVRTAILKLTIHLIRSVVNLNVT